MRIQRSHHGRSSVGSPGGFNFTGAGGASAQPIVLTLHPPPPHPQQQQQQQQQQPLRSGVMLQGLVPQSSAGLLDLLNDSDEECDSNDSFSGSNSSSNSNSNSNNNSNMNSPHIGCIDDVGNAQPYMIYTRTGTSPTKRKGFSSARWNININTSRGISAATPAISTNDYDDGKRRKSIDLVRPADEGLLMRSTSVPIGVSRSGMISPRSQNDIGLDQLSLNSSSSSSSSSPPDGSDSSSSSTSSSTAKRRTRTPGGKDRDESCGPNGGDNSNNSGSSSSSARYYKITQNWASEYLQEERELERRRRSSISECDCGKVSDMYGNNGGGGGGMPVAFAGQNASDREEGLCECFWGGGDRDGARKAFGSESDIVTKVHNSRVLENSCVESRMKDISTCFGAKRVLLEEDVTAIIRQQYEFAAMLNAASKEARTAFELTGDGLFVDKPSEVKMPHTGLRLSLQNKLGLSGKVSLTDSSSNNDDDFDDDDYLSPNEQ